MGSTELGFYDGRADPDHFIRRFRVQATMLLMDEEQKLELMANLLTGKARIVFDTLRHKDVW